MKKLYPYTLILIVVCVLLLPTQVHAWNLSIFPDPLEFVAAFLAVVFNAIMGVMIWLLGFFGMLLNFILNYTIVEMNDRLIELNGINAAWVVVRDLVNISFIFLLLYEAVLLIVGQRNTQNVAKTIGMLVLSALLINFSLFFTKVLIDSSNVVTIGMYNSILKTACVDGRESCGLSDPFSKYLGINTIFSSDNPPSMNAEMGIPALIVFFVGSFILLLATAFVFFVVSVIFFVRYIVLIILLMLSPIAYLGMAFPSIKKHSGEWWDSLKGQLLFGPIYMIFTWLILRLIATPGFIKGAVNLNQAFDMSQPQPSPDAIGMIIKFVIIIALMIYSLIISKKVASEGSNMIGKLTGNATAFAGGAVMGGAARIGRNTAGRWGAGALDNDELKKKAAEGNVRARIQLAAADRFSKSSFDVRGAPGFAGLAKTSGVDLGKYDAKKDNFAAIKKAQADKMEEKAKLYKPTDARYDEVKKKDKETREKAKEDIKNEAWKVQTEAYFASDEWKNTAEGKIDAEAWKIKEDLDKATIETGADAKKMAELNEKLVDAQKTGIIGSEVQVKEDIERLRQEMATKRKNTEDLQTLANQKKEAIDKAINDRKKYSKNTEDTIRKMANDNYKGAEEALNQEYQGRVDNMARRVTGQPELDEKGKPIPRIADRIQSKAADYGLGGAVNVVRKTGRAVGAASAYVGLSTFAGGVVNVVSGGTINMPNSKTDREAYARKIKGVVKGKKSVADLVKEAVEQNGEQPAETAKPEPEPTPPATPPTT